jgi:hypothetical protein
MFRFVCGLCLALWAGACFASDALSFGPPEPWVKIAARPVAPPAGDGDAPVRRLLGDFQVKFDPSADETYNETMVRLQTSAGLAGGAIALTWKPDTETVTVHHAQIIRGDQVIDLLAKGQTFTVLRRETNLERAMLDGVLTASLQPEGLQVGDIVDLAYTTSRHDPILQGHSEVFLGLMPGPAFDRFRLREIWPAGSPMRWRTTPGLPKVVVSKTADHTELLIDAPHVERAKTPKGAPPRYAYAGVLETTAFHDWGEVSALMAPLYVKASTLSESSPLKAEIAKIRAASSDPKTQAAAALHLVQDRVRYLFLSMDQGGYTPADADVTWARRFGDCKAKTALLLALLQGLGVEAEPAMVSTLAGDGADERLPAVEMFDHILVRAQIGGKTYWLDGTRIGDRGLEDLDIPNFHWTLPVRASGGALEPLVVPPLSQPSIETTMNMDASGGLDALAPTRIELVFRGDLATGMRIGLSALSAVDAEKKLKDSFSKNFGWFEAKHATFSYDEATGAEHVTLEGAGSLSWDNDIDSGVRQHDTFGSVIGSRVDYTREPDTDQTAPYAVDYPSYAISTETIVLPQRGQGFTVVGDDVGRTVAGMTFNRVSRIEKDVFTMVTSVRSVAREFPAADAPAAKVALRDMSDVVVKIQAPKTYLLSDEETKVRLARSPTLASEFIDRGDARIWAGQYAQAVSDLDRAVALKPGDAGMLNARCFGRAMAGKDLDVALADCDASLDLDPHEPATLDSRGFVYFRLGQMDKAIADFDAALKRQPRISTSLYVRGMAERHVGKQALGDADIAAAVAIDPMVAAVYAHYGVKPGA